MELNKGKRPYNPTQEDFEIIKQSLKGFSPDLEEFSYYINDTGNIFVKTCSQSWRALAGREWLIDIKKKTARLVAMN